MLKKPTNRLILFFAIAMMLAGIVVLVKRSLPYEESDQLLSGQISIDSILIMGPAVAIYDSSSQKYYWLKSMTSVDMKALDTLKSKKATIRFMKFLEGPLENRIYHLEIDSVMVIDQIIEANQ